MKASLFLAGDDKGSPNAGELAALAAGVLERCYKEIAAAAAIMADLGEDLDRVRIPSVRPKYMEPMGTKVVPDPTLALLMPDSY